MRAIKKIYGSAILLLILISLPIDLSAQDKEEIGPGSAPVIPVPGYVILSNGDTLYGKIKWAMKYTENNPTEVKFIANSGASESFTASEIRGFGNQLEVWMENNPQPLLMEMEHYISLPSFKKGEPVFMNRLMSGKLTVIQNRSAVIIGSTSVVESNRIDGIRFTFSIGEGLWVGPSYHRDYTIIKEKSRFSSYYVIKDGAGMIKLEKENYDSLFKTLFGDCDAVNQELIKNPDLIKFKNFFILAEVYNRICD